ncbi:hypothetical protein BJ508DRAFT_336570 [Ascobolus immersus RN42]|uniref:Uncharacterized protein n=1 Tax=Ascobolus immersus RN42 TaxID=1160509 RepID=A0A3N4HEU2_ASCIM|nr:hypothetical protein BJ508DRAFT_336570 [Ascobolus immersus RN42]
MDQVYYYQQFQFDIDDDPATNVTSPSKPLQKRPFNPQDYHFLDDTQQSKKPKHESETDSNLGPVPEPPASAKHAIHWLSDLTIPGTKKGIYLYNLLWNQEESRVPTGPGFEDPFESPSAMAGAMMSTNEELHYERTGEIPKHMASLVWLPCDDSGSYPAPMHCDMQKFYVFPRHRKLLEELETHEDRFVLEASKIRTPPNSNFSFLSRHCLLQGEEGVGKSAFLNYILFKRLLEGKETFYIERSGRIFAYLKDGFGCGRRILDHYLENVRTTDSTGMYSGAWVLSDSAVPLEDIDKCTVKVIQAALPEEQQFRRWARSVNAAPFRIDAWSWQEFMKLSSIRKDFPTEGKPADFNYYPMFEAHWHRLQVIFDRYGGVPRLVGLLELNGTDEEFESSCQRYEELMAPFGLVRPQATSSNDNLGLYSKVSY